MDKEDISTCLLIILPFIGVVAFWLFSEPITFWQCIVTIILSIPMYFITLIMEFYLLMFLNELFE